MSSPRISVIIPTHERTEKLRAVLEDLTRQSLDPKQVEVLVADDGSSVDPAPALADLALPFSFELLRLPKGGPAAARNRALEKVRAELVLFLNDDVRADPQLLEAHLESHRSRLTPTCILGHFLFPERLRTDLFTRVVEDVGLTITTRHFKAGGTYDYHAFWTGNMSIPREVLERAGGFDESFAEPSHEDIELGIRLERTQRILATFNPRARCEHDHVLTPGSWRRQKRMGGRNALKVHQKHGILKLGAMENAQGLVREELERAWSHYQSMSPQLDQLEALIAALTSPAMEKPHQMVRMGPQTFNLPLDAEAFIKTTVELFEHHDQLAGLVQAGLGLAPS